MRRGTVSNRNLIAALRKVGVEVRLQSDTVFNFDRKHYRIKHQSDVSHAQMKDLIKGMHQGGYSVADFLAEVYRPLKGTKTKNHREVLHDRPCTPSVPLFGHGG